MVLMPIRSDLMISRVYKNSSPPSFGNIHFRQQLGNTLFCLQLARCHFSGSHLSHKSGPTVLLRPDCIKGTISPTHSVASLLMWWKLPITNSSQVAGLSMSSRLRVVEVSFNSTHLVLKGAECKSGWSRTTSAFSCHPSHHVLMVAYPVCSGLPSELLAATVACSRLCYLDIVWDEMVEPFLTSIHAGPNNDRLYAYEVLAALFGYGSADTPNENGWDLERFIHPAFHQPPNKHASPTQIFLEEFTNVVLSSAIVPVEIPALDPLWICSCYESKNRDVDTGRGQIYCLSNSVCAIDKTLKQRIQTPPPLGLLDDKQPHPLSNNLLFRTLYCILNHGMGLMLMNHKLLTTYHNVEIHSRPPPSCLMISNEEVYELLSDLSEVLEACTKECLQLLLAKCAIKVVTEWMKIGLNLLILPFAKILSRSSIVSSHGSLRQPQKFCLTAVEQLWQNTSKMNETQTRTLSVYCTLQTKFRKVNLGLLVSSLELSTLIIPPFQTQSSLSTISSNEFIAFVKTSAPVLSKHLKDIVPSEKSSFSVLSCIIVAWKPSPGDQKPLVTIPRKLESEGEDRLVDKPGELHVSYHGEIFGHPEGVMITVSNLSISTLNLLLLAKFIPDLNAQLKLPVSLTESGSLFLEQLGLKNLSCLSDKELSAIRLIQLEPKIIPLGF
ncbi:uncharacterized protein VP01_1625g11 [Puccinia sorghi]|uniref:Uncharacterized protein n=1 Tax=Puccinia sorghi TaxID=27349 RepID=A0A0L6VHI6_9BASI|nr:uncharacterized protein VP01_1625g11 [Puccinia sorghi]